MTRKCRLAPVIGLNNIKCKFPIFLYSQLQV